MKYEEKMISSPLSICTNYLSKYRSLLPYEKFDEMGSLLLREKVMAVTIPYTRINIKIVTAHYT